MGGGAGCHPAVTGGDRARSGWRRLVGLSEAHRKEPHARRLHLIKGWDGCARVLCCEQVESQGLAGAGELVEQAGRLRSEEIGGRPGAGREAISRACCARLMAVSTPDTVSSPSVSSIITCTGKAGRRGGGVWSSGARVRGGQLSSRYLAGAAVRAPAPRRASRPITG